MYSLHYYTCTYQNNYSPKKCLLIFTWKTLFYHFRCTGRLQLRCTDNRQGNCSCMARILSEVAKCFFTHSACEGVLLHSVGHFWVLRKNTWVKCLHGSVKWLRCHPACPCNYYNNSWQMGFLRELIDRWQKLSGRFKTSKKQKKWKLGVSFRSFRLIQVSWVQPHIQTTRRQTLIREW